MNTKMENMLRNLPIEEIRNFIKHIKQSTHNVWGKEVRLLDKDNKVHTYELQNWYVSVPIYEDTTIEQFINDAKSLLSNYELSRLVEVEPNMSKWENYTLHQLCDWNFLEYEGKQIIKGNQVIFIKYAVILKDLENENKLENSCS